MTIGVLLMAHGTPSGPDDLARYYTDIRGGRPPTGEQLADLRRRYEAIGGASPLRARSEAQASAVADRLGRGFRVALGMKHSAPSIETAIKELERAGSRTIVGIVLAPHFSHHSVDRYLQRARAATRTASFHPVESWHLHPLLVELLADRVADEIIWLLGEVTVLFTAHSLPACIVETGDPYPTQVGATAAAVARQLDLAAGEWAVAWQSAGRTPEPWLGPDVVDVIRRGRGRRSLVVCPIGFVSDHLETLYDLDVLAAAAARARGIAFSRTPALDVDIAPVVADLVLSTIAVRVSRVIA